MSSSMPRKFAMASGVLMLVIGVFAFFPELSTSPLTAGLLPEMRVTLSYGLFVGLLPMNVFNKLALILLGILGIRAAARSERDAWAPIGYSRAVFWAMGFLTLMGTGGPAANTLFGLLPLFGADVWVHGFFTALGAYFGYVHSPRAQATIPDHAVIEEEIDLLNRPTSLGAELGSELIPDPRLNRSKSPSDQKRAV